MNFVDRAVISVKAGDGGKGCVSFRREAFVPKGGPDGGNGGRGGHIYLRADPHLSTLLDFHYKKHYHAENGRPGEGARKTGRQGADLEVRVPCGTQVFEANRLVADLVTAENRVCVAHGGKGGRGNAEFATSTDQAPRRADPGRQGDERTLQLELKLLADVGLVGLPNAGKSTLLSVLTAARPKIAPYPFTTLAPNLGIVRPSELDSFVLADLPGLIEGASDGKGLGHDFLRHIERTRVLLFLIDVTSQHPREDLQVLKKELMAWHPDLDSRPALVVLSKGDLSEGKVPKGPWTMTISAATGQGLDQLVSKLWEMLAAAPLPEIYAGPVSVEGHRES
jgi:GTP-binding protein